ncbi:hypothetical protein [Dactylosporangium sp. NPDC051541]|uniref:hypothetical protein n=1 Tax=Dactylosporangium sp. NPDC051541 TaxID=3363977 RepID=UPI0037A86B70
MLVFDVTALEALFSSHPPVWALLRRADQGLVRLAFPALTLIEAGTVLGVSAAVWEPFLWIPAVTVPPLSAAAAIEISTWPGTPGMRHALWEARHRHCPLVTRRPELYAPETVDIQVV